MKTLVHNGREYTLSVPSGSGLGKSQFMRELTYHVLKNTEEKIGMMFMEESVRRTGLAMMSLEANKPLHLPDVYKTTPKEDFRKYFDRHSEAIHRRSPQMTPKQELLILEV